MLVYANSIPHRFQYITEFAGQELGTEAFQLTMDKDRFQSFRGPKINYSQERMSTDEFWLKPHPLLFEKEIRPQPVTCFVVNGFRAFFKTEGDLPFDIFAACFYLLSRYEEYLPHQKDMYGRYAHENSLAFKEGFLDIPLVNIWLQHFKEQLKQRFPLFIPPSPVFTFIPTYDIDEAYSFRHKGWRRSAGGAIRDLLNGKYANFSLRRKVLDGAVPDPFDSYEWMDDLHRPFRFNPRYFFLVARKTGKYDRNILPGSPALQNLIGVHARKYRVGIHPSWQSGDDYELLLQEIKTIESITKIKITSSRQHFIRLSLPVTYRQLADAGITEDFSMGYGSINGFRASVASPFNWYDLEKEQASYLRLFPFCYMEANSFYEQKYAPGQALEEMRHYHGQVKAVQGTFITIWHNTFLGTSNIFAGWRQVYSQFLREVSA